MRGYRSAVLWAVSVWLICFSAFLASPTPVHAGEIIVDPDAGTLSVGGGPYASSVLWNGVTISNGGIGSDGAREYLVHGDFIVNAGDTVTADLNTVLGVRFVVGNNALWPGRSTSRRSGRQVAPAAVAAASPAEAVSAVPGSAGAALAPTAAAKAGQVGAAAMAAFGCSTVDQDAVRESQRTREIRPSPASPEAWAPMAAWVQPGNAASTVPTQPGMPSEAARAATAALAATAAKAATAATAGPDRAAVAVVMAAPAGVPWKSAPSAKSPSIPRAISAPAAPTPD